MNAAPKWTKVGAIMLNKSGDGKYIKIAEDIKLSKGQFVSIFNPRTRKGITEEQLAKIPDYVVAELFLAPAKA